MAWEALERPKVKKAWESEVKVPAGVEVRTSAHTMEVKARQSPRSMFCC